ncbi:hypothetical protein [Bacteroides clarus]|uniref:hypothetical protein n=1 Tax=Bacteroides clarus TaxID=626929 RepID=UPI001899F2C6|nr:hypothetical protein [Bacteroides clarus]
MENNLDLYNRVRKVPKEAIKSIAAGRLKGMSDINPMWRIRMLTEEFGVCGFGWKYEIIRMWNENGGNGVISSFVHINLFVKMNGEWSEAIQGVGGSSFVTNEKNGLYTSDECFKMALTDAISVACKALGMGADVYWDKDSTKYSQTSTQAAPVTDNRKLLNKELLNDEKLMEWIYKYLTKAKNEGKRLSLVNLINESYKVSQEDINIISANYEQYRINNNLP